MNGGVPERVTFLKILFKIMFLPYNWNFTISLHQLAFTQGLMCFDVCKHLRY